MKLDNWCHNLMKHVTKRLFTCIVLVVLLVSTVSFIAYRIGYATGCQETVGITRGTFVTGGDALKKFRNNDILEGIRRLEAMYYGTAVVLLESPKWRNSFIVETFVPDLIEYRRKFAATQSQWTPTEKILEELLTQWKQKQELGVSFGSP